MLKIHDLRTNLHLQMSLKSVLKEKEGRKSGAARLTVNNIMSDCSRDINMSYSILVNQNMLSLSYSLAKQNKMSLSFFLAKKIKKKSSYTSSQIFYDDIKPDKFNLIPKRSEKDKNYESAEVSIIVGGQLLRYQLFLNHDHHII